MSVALSVTCGPHSLYMTLISLSTDDTPREDKVLVTCARRPIYGISIIPFRLLPFLFISFHFATEHMRERTAHATLLSMRTENSQKRTSERGFNELRKF